MHGVPEFGHALLRELGAPKSPTIETFAEVRFKDSGGKTVIPDGAIVCKRGSKNWTCLVEVKTATNDLRDDQVATYLELAKEQGFDSEHALLVWRPSDGAAGMRGFGETQDATPGVVQVLLRC